MSSGDPLTAVEPTTIGNFTRLAPRNSTPRPCARQYRLMKRFARRTCRTSVSRCKHQLGHSRASRAVLSIVQKARGANAFHISPGPHCHNVVKAFLGHLGRGCRIKGSEPHGSPAERD